MSKFINHAFALIIVLTSYQLQAQPMQEQTEQLQSPDPKTQQASPAIVAPEEDLHFEDMADYSLDALLNLAMTVTTSGKEERSLADVADVVYVVTQEDIKNSGAINIPEALRLVPGLLVSQVSPTHYEVSLRTNESFMANDYLVMIDSRPTYINIMKTYFWNGFPVVLEEIERIEVILGNASILYGSNAMLGVINIITKKKSDKRINANASIGPQIGRGNYNSYDNTRVGLAWYETFGKLSTKLAFSFTHINPWDDTETEYDLTPQGNTNYNGSLSALWDINTDSALTFSAGIGNAQGDFTPFYRQPVEATLIFGDIQYEHSNILFDNDSFDLRLQMRTNIIDISLLFDPIIPVEQFDTTENSFAVNTYYRFQLANRFTTTIGLDYEFQMFDTDFFELATNGLSYANAWLHERIKIHDKLIFTVGGRLQDRIYDGEHALVLIPKATLLYKPASNHTIRLVAGSGFEYPMPFELFTNLTVLNDALTVLQGNPDTKHMKTHNIQIGYQYNLAKILMAKIDFYYAQIVNEIDLFDTENPLIISQVGNEEGTIPGYGTELYVVASPLHWLNVKAGYSINIFERDYFDNAPKSPLHKVNLALNIRPIEKLYLGLQFYGTSFYYEASPAVENTVINPQTLLNANVRYEITDFLSVVFHAYNILPLDFGDQFRDNALDTESMLPSTAKIGSRFMLGLNASF